MKRILLTLITLLITFFAYSQSIPIEFMGIPVDSTKEYVESKLLEKGFQHKPYSQNLTGEFDGIDVNLAVVTTKGKVSRICLSNKKGVDKSTVKTLYNRLVYEFENNHKYFRPNEDSTKYEIPENENIEYQILVNDKNYEAHYFQLVDTKKPEVMKIVAKHIFNKINLDSLKATNTKDLYDKKLKLFLYTAILDYSANRHVWFFIHRNDNNRYFINLYYDNEDNRPHGEDL